MTEEPKTTVRDGNIFFLLNERWVMLDGPLYEYFVHTHNEKYFATIVIPFLGERAHKWRYVSVLMNGAIGKGFMYKDGKLPKKGRYLYFTSIIGANEKPVEVNNQ